MRRGFGNCSRRLLTCRRKQYYGVRTAAQFVVPLLNTFCVPNFSLQSNVQLEQLTYALLGVPSSLTHEGPLDRSHLGAFTTFQEGELVRMLTMYLPDVLEKPSPSLHVSAMWSPFLQKRYVQETMRMRIGEVKKLSPPRFEAGLAAHSVFSEMANTTCSSLHTYHFDNATEKEEHVKEERWSQLIDNYSLILPDRSSLHELENLPQEIGIGELLSSFLPLLADDQTDIETIIDVGGGNGFLAAQLAEIFHCESFVVDPFTPRHAIDNVDFPHWGKESVRRRSRVPRRYPLRRICQRLTDVDWRDISINFNKCALVAKHLCGTAIDSCLRHLQSIDRLPHIIVFVPCCFNKGCYTEYCNPTYINNIASVDAEIAWNQWTRLTDWNRSCQQQQEMAVVDNMRNYISVRREKGHRKKTMNHLLPCMEDISYMVEAIINYGRVLWLRKLGYHAKMVTYVPRCVTPKNRAIVAIRCAKFK